MEKGVIYLKGEDEGPKFMVRYQYDEEFSVESLFGNMEYDDLLKSSE